MNLGQKSIFLLAMLAALGAPPLALADTLWIGESGKNNPIAVSGVKVLRLDENSIVYQSSNGSNEVTKPLSQMQQMAADGETDFNGAEEAYRNGKSTEAADGYQKAIQATAKDWVRDRSAYRLADLAPKVNRFDIAVTAYLAIVQKDPAAAVKMKPAITDPNSPALDSAVVNINKALESPKLSDAQRGALLSFLLEIYRAKKDTANVNQTLGQLVKYGAASPADMAAIKLASARIALDTKDYNKALSELEQNRQLFTDPVNQADALFILASAKDGIDAGKDEVQELKDIAIAYMRVVAFAKDVAGQPHVAASLLRVAQLEEALKESPVALSLYQQIAKDYADQPEAADAKASIERLGAGS